MKASTGGKVLLKNDSEIFNLFYSVHQSCTVASTTVMEIVIKMHHTTIAIVMILCDGSNVHLVFEMSLIDLFIQSKFPSIVESPKKCENEFSVQTFCLPISTIHIHVRSRRKIIKRRNYFACDQFNINFRLVVIQTEHFECLSSRLCISAVYFGMQTLEFKHKIRF